MNRRRFSTTAGAFIAALSGAMRGGAKAKPGEISVADFIGPFGATDVALQKAIDAAVEAGFSTVRLPALDHGRTYEVRGTVRNDGVQLVGDGATTVLRKIGPGSCFISGRVPRKTVFSLVADLPVGTDRIDLSPYPLLQPKVGSVYVLTSEGRCHSNTPAHCGEFLVITAVANGVASIDGPLQYAYRRSEGASIRDAALVAGAAYSDLHIEMDPTVVPPSAMTRFDNYAIQLDFCRSPLVSNVSVSNGVAAGIRLLGCLDARVKNYKASGLGSAEEDQHGTSTIGLGGYGYGVAERGLNRGLIVDGAVTDRVRHLYTSGAEWVDMFKFGMPTSSLISNSTSRNAKGACFDTHETGMNIAFENCHAEAGQAVGFQLRSKNARMTSCTARNLGGAAVWIYGANIHENAAGDGCVVSDLRCEDTNTARPSRQDGNVDWIERGAILDQGFGNQFKAVHIERCGGPALVVAAEARGGVYEGVVASKVCQATKSMRFVVVVEQNTGDAAPKIAGLRVTDSPRALNVMKVTNPTCRPELLNVSVN
jgi:hypothetical protein